ncbi:MAG: TonB-dependent receptor plug domain-containing protein, partial [Chlorobi bacterium]|nr:TonB-dependent receptor plug domain-containing protein [Chlorobiota bacterium]
DKTVDDYANSIFLLVQRGEKKQLLQKKILKNKQIEFNISVSEMPFGLLLFTFFDNDLNLVGERIYFHAPKNQLQSVVINQKQQNDSLILTMENNKPVSVNSTLFVQSSNSDFTKKMDVSIQNYLWLKADLPDINNKILKLNLAKNESVEYLNNYLVSKKWARFSLEKTINNEFPEIRYKPEHYLVVSGKIQRQYIKLPLSYSPVELTVLNEFRFSQKDTTDESGSFYFDGIDYEDTISIKITARRWINDKENVLITLNAGDLPPINYNNKNILYNWFKETYKKESRKLKFASRNTEYKPDTADDGHLRLYKHADYILKINHQNGSAYTNVLDLLRGRVPGLVITGSGASAKVTIRGINSIYGSNEPLYLVDGMEVSRATFNSLSPNDVDKIEVVTGTQSAMYGARGANGIIALYTKKGFKVIKGKVIFDMLGYQNIKNNNDLQTSKLFGKSVTKWSPVPKINENGNVFFKIPSVLNAQFYIEDINNGIPERFELKIK